jgi:hypothetical protein
MGLMGYFGFSDRGFFFPIIFCWFRESWWGHCPWIVFSQIYFTFFKINVPSLRSGEPFFQCGLLRLVFVGFFLYPMLSTGHIHRLIVDKIAMTMKDVERVKHTLSITLGYILLWNVIVQIYFLCPTPQTHYFSLKVEE